MGLILFENTYSCAIGIASDASAPERFAAEELQRYLALATGGSFPIVHCSDQPGVLVGEIGQSKVDLPALSEDGYLMQRAGAQVVLLGGESAGDTLCRVSFSGNPGVPLAGAGI